MAMNKYYLLFLESIIFSGAVILISGRSTHASVLVQTRTEALAATQLFSGNIFLKGMSSSYQYEKLAPNLSQETQKISQVDKNFSLMC